MGLGLFQLRTDLDSTTTPDDTLVTQDPDADERIKINWYLIVVTTPQGSATIQLEDGAGGDALSEAYDASAAGSFFRQFTEGSTKGARNRGLVLSKGSGLNATIAGASSVAAFAIVDYEVIGG